MDHRVVPKKNYSKRIKGIKEIRVINYKRRTIKTKKAVFWAIKTKKNKEFINVLNKKPIISWLHKNAIGSKINNNSKISRR